MNEIPSALAAVKGQARWRGSRWSPLTAGPLRERSTYGGVSLPALIPSQHEARVHAGIDI